MSAATARKEARAPGRKASRSLPLWRGWRPRARRRRRRRRAGRASRCGRGAPRGPAPRPPCAPCARASPGAAARPSSSRTRRTASRARPRPRGRSAPPRRRGRPRPRRRPAPSARRAGACTRRSRAPARPPSPAGGPCRRLRAGRRLPAPATTWSSPPPASDRVDETGGARQRGATLRARRDGGIWRSRFCAWSWTRSWAASSRPPGRGRAEHAERVSGRRVPRVADAAGPDALLVGRVLDGYSIGLVWKRSA
ncbi:hypothetical protein PVAP13_4NG070188 [Panicum virgatum]|uniref:Uncharacterized protein n=1 Tax=Panicum virgatum TaxID=38727 RepID=A0A8T0SZ99_PANVG|nr:hypothetical protein PVAP13_4NG070188 [Panicum virgatum]